MAKQTVNIGTSANKGNGDPLRTAFTKINENFTEIYTALTDGVNFAQVNADWNAVSGVAQILNKPTIPTNTNQLVNGAGFITGTNKLASGSAEVILTGGANPYVTFPAITGGNQLGIQGSEIATLSGTLGLTSLTDIALNTNGANDGDIGLQSWNFGADGNLTVPGNISIGELTIQEGFPGLTVATGNNLAVGTARYETVSADAYIGADDLFSADIEFNNNITVVQVGWIVSIGGTDYTVTVVDAGVANQYRIIAAGATFVTGTNYTFRNPTPIPYAWVFGNDGNITLPTYGGLPQDTRTGITFGDGSLQTTAYNLDQYGNLNVTNFVAASAFTNYGGAVFIRASRPDAVSTLDFEFNENGQFKLPAGGGVIEQNNSWTKTTTPVVNIGPGTVVWTSNVDYISSAKLVIQVEASETGDDSGWHSQACEAIIACRGYAGVFGGPGGDPQMVVYGIVHTSINPLVTFTVRRNLTTNFVEVVGTLTATAGGAADLRIHSVEMSTRD